MNKHKKTKCTKGSIGKVRIVPDFLPAPIELVKKEETIKVTISLTKESIDFFKEEAEVHHTHYQRMIRNLLEQYAAHYRNQHKG